MIFGKIFHLSKEGSKAIVQAGIWLALFNLAALLPVILLAMASEKMITLYGHLLFLGKPHGPPEHGEGELGKRLGVILGVFRDVCLAILSI